MKLPTNSLPGNTERGGSFRSDIYQVTEILKNLRAVCLISLTALITFTSCNKDRDTYIWTGQVVDQVTNFPVENAYVSLIKFPLCESHHVDNNYNLGPVVLSGSDGRFKLGVSIDEYSKHIKGGCIYMYSWKEGYARSSYVLIQSGSLQNIPAPIQGEVNSIQLYRFGQLNIHVTNDTINNNIDEINLYYSDKAFPATPPPEGVVYQNCKGKDFDTIFIYDNLVSNTICYIKAFTKCNDLLLCTPIFNKTIMIKPDTITLVSVTF